jgi:hypothetical protein
MTWMRHLMQRRTRAASNMLWALVACGSPTSDNPGEDGSTGGDGTTGPSDTTGDSQSTTSAATTAGSSETSTTDTGSNDDAICIVDGNGRPLSFCDIHNPECGPGPHGCPEGQKCSLSEVCEPVPPDPAGVGEPCTVADNGGIDDCVVDALCVGPPGRTQGVCIDACDPPYPLSCAEDEVCMSVDVGSICLPRCDPLAPSCAEGSVCQLLWDDELFVCSPPASTFAGEGEACEHEPGLEPVCGPGLVCLPDMSCVQVCAVDDPDMPCDNICNPIGLSDYPNVGMCL